MKKILIFIIPFFCVSNAYCQGQKVFIYGEEGLGYGTHFSFKTAVNCISNDHILSVSYYHNSRPAPDAPSDYRAGLLAGLPKQKLNMFGLMYGKVFYSQMHTTRYTLKGGIALGNARTPANYQENGIGGYIYSFDPNYSYSYHTVFNYGMVLNPTIEFPVGTGFGFSIGAFSIVDPVSSSVGVEGSLLFGKLRNKKAGKVIK